MSLPPKTGSLAEWLNLKTAVSRPCKTPPTRMNAGSTGRTPIARSLGIDSNPYQFLGVLEIEASLAPLLAHKDRSGRLIQDADHFGPTTQLAGAVRVTKLSAPIDGRRAFSA